MKISVVIVSWNVCDLLRNCLTSLQKYGGRQIYEILVIDNASADASVAMVENEFSAVRLFKMGFNAGFAKANNRGIQEATGDLIFILNPDTEIHEGTIPALVKYMEMHADVMLASPRICNPDGSFQEGSVRANPNVWNQLVVLFKLQRLVKVLKLPQKYYKTDFDPLAEQDVEQVMGAAMLFRAAALRQVGMFDERFFLWFEEVDICKRMQNARMRIGYAPEAMVIHHGAASFRQRLPLSRQLLYNRSVSQYFYKHYGWWPFIFFVPAFIFNIVASFIYQLIRGNGN